MLKFENFNSKVKPDIISPFCLRFREDIQHSFNDLDLDEEFIFRKSFAVALDIDHPDSIFFDTLTIKPLQDNGILPKTPSGLGNKIDNVIKTGKIYNIDVIYLDNIMMGDTQETIPLTNNLLQSLKSQNDLFQLTNRISKLDPGVKTFISYRKSPMGDELFIYILYS